ncbi:hypothetical protein D9M73_229270 [compost metagenome]
MVQFILGSLEPALEGSDTRQVGAVVQLFQLFPPLHLLQEKLRVLHRDFERQLAPFQGQQVQGSPRCALQCLVGVVELRRTLQRQALLALGGIGETVGMDGTRQLAVTRRELIEIQPITRLQVEQGEMTGSSHTRLRR